MKTIHLYFLVCILLCSACGAPPSTPAASSPTPWVGGTQTALAVASQNALPASPSPTFTPSAMEKPADFSHVLYGGKFHQSSFFLLLGGVSTNGWLAPDLSVARYSGEATYSLHTLAQEYKYFVRGKAPEFSPICQTYSIGTDAPLDEVGMVAVVDGWNITKREVTELPADNQLYRQAVLDWLAAEGVDEPQLSALQIFRVDIEGDGTDEIFISAAHLDDSQHTTQAGDYSIILMRKVLGNEAVTLPIVADVYHSRELEMTFPRTYSLANFIDLNQDGVLEVFVDIRGWEKFGAILFQIDGDDVIQTLSAEC